MYSVFSCKVSLSKETLFDVQDRSQKLQKRFIKPVFKLYKPVATTNFIVIKFPRDLKDIHMQCYNCMAIVFSVPPFVSLIFDGINCKNRRTFKSHMITYQHSPGLVSV